MARQIERAESLARILDVNETFSADSQGDQNWESVLELYDHQAMFAEHQGAVSAEAVIRFYVLDRQNPGSVLSSLHMARENARAVRPLISTEMWVHLNTFHARVCALRDRDLAEENLNRLCTIIKEHCQAQMGIAAETFYRDEGWYFYRLGMNLERADQTSRLLDAKYHLLLSSPQDIGSPVDRSQWSAVLRSAAGFHAYRRVHPHGRISPVGIAEFLLLDQRFPRAVSACVDEAARTLTKLRGMFVLSRGTAAQAHLTRLRDDIVSTPIETAIDRGLHEYLDWIQRELIAVTDQLGLDFFGLDRKAA